VPLQVARCRPPSRLPVRTGLVPLTLTFHTSRRFDPSHSLLGRAVRRWTGDPLRGEAVFYLVLSALVLALLMAHYLGWALLQPLMEADATESWQVLFWIGQLASVGLVTAIGGIGFRPGVEVAFDPETASLHLQQGASERRLGPSDVREATRISAQRYHMHYRRYAATDAFVAEATDDMLLLRTADGPVVLALPSADALETMRAHLTAQEADPASVMSPGS